MSQMNKEFDGPSGLTAMDRRDFMRSLGFLSGMSILSYCSRKADHIIPFSHELQEFSKTDYEYYTTAFASAGLAQGILAKSFQGRPIKIEGNPLHPQSLGATTPQAQGSLFDLYHKDRLQNLQENLPSTKDWGDGTGIVFFFSPVHSPLRNTLIRKLQKKYPKSLWVAMAPWKVTRWNQFDLKSATKILSFDEDIFSCRPDSLRLAREYNDRRKALNYKLPLISYHSSPSLTSAKATERHTLSREEIWNKVLEYKSRPQNDALVFISPALHPEALALEAEINRSRTLDFTLPENSTVEEALKSNVKTLVMIEVDPFLWYPAKASALKKIPQKIALSLTSTKTTDHSDLVIATSHYLEDWGDLKSCDGNVSIVQPLIRPLFHSISVNQFLSYLHGENKSSLELVKEAYKNRWESALQTGVVYSEQKSLSLKAKNLSPLPKAQGHSLKLVPDPFIGFGETHKNPLLQELPRPFSRLTWQNAFGISAQIATALRLKKGDILELRQGPDLALAPVIILPHLDEQTILVNQGYGNFAFGAGPVSVRKTTRNKKLATTQDELNPHPTSHSTKKELLSLHPSHPLPHQKHGPQWGMAIDMDSCIGCEACVIACQVENNIPYVGEDQVAKSRILHWIRIDTYLTGEDISFQPVPCMHCESAPCEVVCPVNATVHGNGGLNEMVYNRCVGTRYCSNNCPYRVRKFNFRAYSALKPPYTLGLNPEVSVRDRGVMEKCTYCVQRLRSENPVTACAQVCPTQAITFGNIADPKSAVSGLKSDKRHFVLLEETGVRPRTTYLHEVRT